MIRALLKRLKRPKQTRPKLYYDGAHDSQVLPRDSMADSLIPLEPRFMFDAAGVATGAEVAAETVAQEQAEQALENAPVAPVPAAVVESTEKLLEALSLVDAPANDVNEIIFIDSQVDDYQTLLQGVDSNAEVVFIDSDRDGMEQIAEVLAERDDIEAIHIIAHGDAGQLQLGNTLLTEASMQGEHADELAIINTALSENADILIYGCNFGQGDTGERAANVLARLTGADIAASDDLTGAAALGGDAELEVHKGSIEADTLFSQDDFDRLNISLNSAPVATATDAFLAAEAQPAANPPGETVENLFSSVFFDPDPVDDLDGVAVVGNTANAGTEGEWQYSTGGGIWTDIGTSVSDSNALVLTETDLLRFVPVVAFTGQPPDLDVRLSSGVSLTVIDDVDVNSSPANLGPDNTTLNPDGFDSGFEIRTLLQWDLSSIAPMTPVDSVQLEIELFDASPGTYEIYAADTDDWDEDDAEWTDADTLSGPLLGTITANSNGTTQIDLNSDGITAVQAWINTPSSNTGFAIASGGTTDGIDFYAKESTVGAAPQLNITFSATGAGVDINTQIGDPGTFSDEIVNLATDIVAAGTEISAVDDTGTTDEDSVLNVAAPGVLANDTDLNLPSIVSGVTLDFDGGDTNDDGVWFDNTGNDREWYYNGSSGSDATFNASPTTSLPGITSAYTFDGTNSGMIFDNTGGGTDSFSVFNERDDATFEIWFKPSDLSGTEVIFETGGAGDDGVAIYMVDNILKFVVQDFSKDTAVLTFDLSTINTSEFVQVVGVFDEGAGNGNDSVQFYVNNTLAGNVINQDIRDWSGNDDAGLGTFTGSSIIEDVEGIGPGLVGDFAGEIAIFRYYNQNAFSAADVQQNYDVVAGLSVTEVNGMSADVGNPTGLLSGALLTLNDDGSYDYDPNGAFENLDFGESTTDTFEYTVSDGTNSVTADVVITINGVDHIDITLSADTASIDEEGVTDDDVIYTITLDNNPSAGNTVDVVVANIGSSDDADFTQSLDLAIAASLPVTGVSYNAGSNTLSFADTFIAGSFSFSFTLTASDDATVEGTETIDIELSAASITNGSVTVAGGAVDNLSTIRYIQPFPIRS